MMRRWLLLSLMLSGLIGCSNITGPIANRRSPERIDDPLYSIEEQERRGRERLSLPEDDRMSPNTYMGRYGPTGR